MRRCSAASLSLVGCSVTCCITCQSSFEMLNCVLPDQSLFVWALSRERFHSSAPCDVDRRVCVPGLEQTVASPTSAVQLSRKRSFVRRADKLAPDRPSRGPTGLSRTRTSTLPVAGICQAGLPVVRYFDVLRCASFMVSPWLSPESSPDWSSANPFSEFRASHDIFHAGLAIRDTHLHRRPGRTGIDADRPEGRFHSR